MASKSRGKQTEDCSWLNLDELKARAVSAMAFARPRRSGLLVGCALYDTKHTIFTGANVEVQWQRSYHAEEVAVVSAMTHDAGGIKAICISADRKLFTPCGHCLDLIMEFATRDCLVLHVNPRTKRVSKLNLSDMMPYYPSRD